VPAKLTSGYHRDLQLLKAPLFARSTWPRRRSAIIAHALPEVKLHPREHPHGAAALRDRGRLPAGHRGRPVVPRRLPARRREAARCAARTRDKGSRNEHLAPAPDRRAAQRAHAEHADGAAGDPLHRGRRRLPGRHHAGGRRTHQPFGLLHGGATAALAETLGSAAANCCLDAAAEYAVGLEINANHLRGVRSGQVTGTRGPLHIGRRTQVWETRIEDDAGRLVCVSRLTLAVVPRAGLSRPRVILRPPCLKVPR
jgi:uncharacterized protein (TIGR00369 family)